MEFSRVVSLLACVCLADAALAAPAEAEDAAAFYKGKRMTMYIGSAAGGGTDLYARLIARFMGNHIPGAPVLTPTNVPGADGLVLANELYNTLPKDGTAIGTFDRYIPLEALIGNPAAKLDPVKFNWLGSTNIDYSTCVTWHSSGINNLHDFMTKEVIVGSGPVYHPNILNNIFGAHLKHVKGYPGADAINLAMEHGELQARCHWSWSGVVGTRSDWLRDKKINVIIQFADRKHPDLPNVPLASELAKTESEREILDLVNSAQVMARPFTAPPGVPADRLKVLRTAFAATLADPAFKEATQKQQLELEPVSAERIQNLVVQIAKTPRNVIDLFRDKVMTQ